MIYIIIGVSGSGKTSVGSMLANHLSIPFYDGDDYHPTTNIEKLSKGLALTDDDRHPWLVILAEKIEQWNATGDAVLACSALKESYRQILSSIPNDRLTWITLLANKSVIENRLRNRKNHFFNPTLLDSQFETFEAPTYGVHIDAGLELDAIIKVVIQKTSNKSTLGLIGLGVMGKSLARNIAGHGFSLSVYNRHVPGKEEKVAANFAKEYSELPLTGFDDIDKFLASCSSPRIIILMVNAGQAVDSVLENLSERLDAGDIIIDGGNSLYSDTINRQNSLAEKNLEFFGLGVSGGEEGALKGPSLMPGGNPEAYALISPILDAIAAKDVNGAPCCGYVGRGGAGHFTKMVHNGLEYAEMQLLAEVYFVMRFYSGLSLVGIREEFQLWKEAGLGSYLLDITIDILAVKEGERYLLDQILDKASNKGTGSWTIEAAAKLGMPLSTISEALSARFLSSKKKERIAAEKLFESTEDASFELPKDEIKEAYAMARRINHAIGFDLLAQASQEYKWDLNLAEIARIWTNGCIIRSSLMEEISAYTQLKEYSLLAEPQYAQKLRDGKLALKRFVASAVLAEAPVPVFSAALNYFLQYKTANSSANLIQAQRDYFGAHTYQRIEEGDESFYHSEWQNLKF